MSGPLIASAASKIAPALASLKDPAMKAAGALNDAGQFGEETSATVPLAPVATGEAATQAANALPGYQQAANVGLEQAAQKEQKLVTPIGAQAVQSAQQQQNAGTQQLQSAVQQYQSSVKDVNDKQLAAEQALQDANNVSQIDPQKYINTMGVGSKTITALGIALSGLGAGLTGQPNMAMSALQKNIDRDIEAQKQVFFNKMQEAAQAQGLLKTAQDRQQLAIAAQQAATITVNSGISNAISGIQTQVAGAVAPDLVNTVKLKASQDVINTLGQYNQNYIQTVKSGNNKNLKLSGLAADAVAEHITGSRLGLNPQPLQKAKAMGEGNPALSTTQNANPNLNSILSNESAQRNKAASHPGESFLDALSKAGAPK